MEVCCFVDVDSGRTQNMKEAPNGDKKKRKKMKKEAEILARAFVSRQCPAGNCQTAKSPFQRNVLLLSCCVISE